MCRIGWTTRKECILPCSIGDTRSIWLWNNCCTNLSETADASYCATKKCISFHLSFACSHIFYHSTVIYIIDWCFWHSADHISPDFSIGRCSKGENAIVFLSSWKYALFNSLFICLKSIRMLWIEIQPLPSSLALWVYPYFSNSPIRIMLSLSFCFLHSSIISFFISRPHVFDTLSRAVCCSLALWHIGSHVKLFSPIHQIISCIYLLVCVLVCVCISSSQLIENKFVKKLNSKMLTN